MSQGQAKIAWRSVAIYSAVFVAAVAVRVSLQTSDRNHFLLSLLPLAVAAYGWFRLVRWARGYWLAEMAIVLGGLSTFALWLSLNAVRVLCYEDAVEHEGSRGSVIFDMAIRTQHVLQPLGFVLMACLLIPPIIWAALKMMNRSPR